MSRKKTIILSAIIFTIIAGTTFTVIYLIQNKKPSYITNSGEYFITDDITSASNIEITNNIKNLSVSFEFLPENSTLILNATWNYNYTESTDVSINPIQIEISSETENNVFYLTFNEILNGSFPDLQYWECTIKLSQNFENYSFLSDSEEGDVFFKCYTDLAFDRFEFYSTTGRIKVELNHTLMNADMFFESTDGNIDLFMDLMFISGDLFCETYSGDVLFNFWNLKFLTNSSVYCLVHEDGFINVRWAQHIYHNNNVSISLISKNNIEFRLWCPFEFIRYNVTLEAPLDCNLMGSYDDYWISTGLNSYQSYNINESNFDLFNIFMKSLETKVYIKPVDCFKPQRFCDQTNDTMPYDVYEEGDFELPQNIFIGTSIEIYNHTKNVYINITNLDANSTNIIEAYWNLTYEHGSGRGYGLLKINCTYEIVDDILKIHINLDYTYYLISPFYKSGEIIAYVHPDYTYSLIS